MATSKSKMSKNKTKSSKKINKNKATKVLLPISVFIIAAFILYTIINLIIVPTEMFLIENDIISIEESTIRICNKG